MATMTENTPDPSLPYAVPGAGDAAAQRLTVSRIVRLRGASAFPLNSWRQARRLALVLAVGLPAIMLAFHFLDPGAAAPYIVLPVLAGGLLPLLMPPTGRFEVVTDDAHALAGTLDETLAALGYAREETGPHLIRYRERAPSRGRPIAVTLGERQLAISGPVGVLQGLRQHLAR
jgi:hypothetical protein